jgi:hypothetical protein
MHQSSVSLVEHRAQPSSQGLTYYLSLPVTLICQAISTIANFSRETPSPDITLHPQPLTPLQPPVVDVQVYNFSGSLYQHPPIHNLQTIFNLCPLNQFSFDGRSEQQIREQIRVINAYLHTLIQNHHFDQALDTYLSQQTSLQKDTIDFESAQLCAPIYSTVKAHASEISDEETLAPFQTYITLQKQILELKKLQRRLTNFFTFCQQRQFKPPLDLNFLKASLTFLEKQTTTKTTQFQAIKETCYFSWLSCIEKHCCISNRPKAGFKHETPPPFIPELDSNAPPYLLSEDHTHHRTFFRVTHAYTSYFLDNPYEFPHLPSSMQNYIREIIQHTLAHPNSFFRLISHPNFIAVIQVLNLANTFSLHLFKTIASYPSFQEATPILAAMTPEHWQLLNINAVINPANFPLLAQYMFLRTYHSDHLQSKAFSSCSFSLHQTTYTVYELKYNGGNPPKSQRLFIARSAAGHIIPILFIENHLNNKDNQSLIAQYKLEIEKIVRKALPEAKDK